MNARPFIGTKYYVDDVASQFNMALKYPEGRVTRHLTGSSLVADVSSGPIEFPTWTSLNIVRSTYNRNTLIVSAWVNVFRPEFDKAVIKPIRLLLSGGRYKTEDWSFPETLLKVRPCCTLGGHRLMSGWAAKRPAPSTKTVRARGSSAHITECYGDPNGLSLWYGLYGSVLLQLLHISRRCGSAYGRRSCE